MTEENLIRSISASVVIGKYEVRPMDDNRWRLFLDDWDTGRSYARLTDARRAIKNEELKERFINGPPKDEKKGD